MPAAQLILLAVGYAFIQHFLARGTVSRVMEADLAYAGRWAKPSCFSVGGNSAAVLHIMLNMNLPEAQYPRPLQLRIWVARVMLWLWPFVIVAVLIFST